MNALLLVLFLVAIGAGLLFGLIGGYRLGIARAFEVVVAVGEEVEPRTVSEAMRGRMEHQGSLLSHWKRLVIDHPPTLWELLPVRRARRVPEPDDRL